MNSMRKTKRGVIYPTYVCNLRCRFCYYVDKLKKGAVSHEPLEKMIAEVDRLRVYYKLEYVDFCGGEPTVYPWVKELVKHCIDIKLQPCVITNCQRPSMLDELITLGLDDLLLSIEGVDEIHDYLVARKGAFNKVVETLELLWKREFKFRVNTVVMKQNLNHLEDLVDFLKSYNPRMINLIVFNPHYTVVWGQTQDIDFQARYSELASVLKSAIDKCDDLGIWTNVRYFPLCFMEGYEEHVCNWEQILYDPYEWDLVARRGWDRSEENYHKSISAMVAKSKKPPKCGQCANRSICSGIYEQYLSRFGDKEISPINGEKIIDPMFYRRQSGGWT